MDNFFVKQLELKPIEFYADPDRAQNLEKLAEAMLAVLGNFEWDSQKLQGTVTLLANREDQRASDNVMLETILKANGFLMRKKDL